MNDDGIMKEFLLTAVIALVSSHALAQTPDPTLATPTGHEVNIGAGSYTYTEPGAPRISIRGPKIAGGYAGTLTLNKSRLWFFDADVRGSVGDVTYDGACAPWLIRPNSSSPNGYELDLGEFSPCSETGDTDWYVEARAVIGKDFIGPHWAFAPRTGVGFRHLSNGTTGIAGFRTDEYLYVPLGLTARTKVASDRALSLDVEYDRLIQGWQNTRNSALGSGEVPPTTTAPGFTIDGFTDLSFAQDSGWALRAGAKYEVTKRWSVTPYYVRWRVAASSVNYETVAFTVNNVTAHEQLGAYEPVNVTNELGVKLGFRF